MKRCKKNGLMLFAVGAACGALCYQLIKNRKDARSLEDEDFDGFDDEFMDEPDKADDTDADMNHEPGTDETA